MQPRARIVVGIGLLVAALVLAVVAWTDPSDWKPLLLFTGVVGIAAWGWGRGARIPARAPHVHADAPVPKEPVR